MATLTYDPIASTTLTSSASSVTFSSLDTIAAGYRDLVLVMQVAGTSGREVRIRFNGDTGANYPYVRMRGNGSVASSGTGTSGAVGLEGFTAGIANSITSIMDYSATDKHKSYINRSNIPDLLTDAVAGRWSNTAAITSLELVQSSGDLAAGSTFSLYGIVA